MYFFTENYTTMLRVEIPKMYYALDRTGPEVFDLASTRFATIVYKTHVFSPEPETLRILMATTKSTIRQAMKGEWDQNWESAKHSRDLFRLGGPARKRGP